MKNTKWVQVALKHRSVPSAQVAFPSDDGLDTVVKVCNLPSLSVKAYATSAKGVQKKQLEVRRSLQYATDAIRKDLESVYAPVPKKKKYAIKIALQRKKSGFPE